MLFCVKHPPPKISGYAPKIQYNIIELFKQFGPLIISTWQPWNDARFSYVDAIVNVVRNVKLKLEWMAKSFFTLPLSLTLVFHSHQSIQSSHTSWQGNAVSACLKCTFFPHNNPMFLFIGYLKFPAYVTVQWLWFSYYFR